MSSLGASALQCILHVCIISCIRVFTLCRHPHVLLDASSHFSTREGRISPDLTEDL